MQLRQEIKQGLKQEQWMKLQMMQFMKILQRNIWNCMKK